MNFIDRLKKHEGFRSKMYKDSVGVPTIGYGFNLETIELPEAVAELWLAHEVDKKRRQMEKYDWYKYLDPVRKDVILDMAFNLGISGLLKFKNMIAAIKDKDYEKAAAEMLDSKWAGQVGKRAMDLAQLMKGNNDTGI